MHVTRGGASVVIICRLIACLVVIAHPVCAAAQADDAWSLVPRNAYAAVIVPSVKRANNDLSAMLEGMDRASALLGPNPMETLLLSTGLTGALREDGAAAIVLMESDLANAAPQEPVFVLPANDPEAWVAENFIDDASATDGRKRLKGDESIMVYVTAGERHVIVARSRPVLDAYHAAPRDLERTVTVRLPEESRRPVLAGEIVFYASPRAVQRLARASMQQRGLWPGGAPQPASSETSDELAQDVPKEEPAALGLDDDDAIALMGVNFDPLGLGIRTVTAFSEGSISAGLTKGGPGHHLGFGSLPNYPFFLAGSIDVQGLGGAAVLERLSGGMMPLPEWLGTTRAIQFVSSPSVLGIQGGLMNETAVVVSTGQPDELRTFIQQELMSMPREVGTLRREPVWSDKARDFDGLIVDSFEVKQTWPANEPTGPMVESLLFGRGGIRGYVGTVGNHVIMTLSQRRDVYERTAKAATGEARTLGENAMVQSMRDWLPPRADIEVFIGIGQFGQVLQQVRQMIPMNNVPIPTIDPKTKPIGLALAVDDGRMETGAVIPADVLALVFDQALEMWQQFSGGGFGGFGN